MSFLAPPPHLSAASGRYLLRRKRPVFFPVPLRSKMRVGACQIVHAGPNLASGADRAAAAKRRAVVNRLLPLVSQPVNPPDLLSGADCDGVRGKSAVSGTVPLLQQIRTAVLNAVFPQRGSARICVHVPHPSFRPPICGVTPFDDQAPKRLFPCLSGICPPGVHNFSYVVVRNFRLHKNDRSSASIFWMRRNGCKKTSQ